MAAPGSPDWKQKVERLQQKWQELAAGGREDSVLSKASATLQSLSTHCSEEKDILDIASFFHLYTKAILDITFFEENQLVDRDFQGDDSLSKVRELIQILSEPEHLVKEFRQNQKAPVADLDVELSECLHWRRGALLYMYCHTVGEHEGWCLQNKGTFLQCLKDGTSYLLKMLTIRSPVHLNEEVLFQDLNTATLLSKGIFSDIHVLALMYCGEMCYWALNYCRHEEQVSHGHSDRSSTTLDFQEVGEGALDKYVSVCEGPLHGQGWNTEKAKTMQEFFKKIKS
ncbi:UPF0600 protein C5orf51 homolog [Xenopus laevis]|uniref:UPF0600 protein C5orf51 homolog n=2 Tax=Xenopus laevis TaxID=8355 RepID=A0A1L8I2G9_XENLA|nr:UPF0600 protein C5orf51 homolog [Xenopus laevis]OCU02567.1 hypothetical protein XELAEV_18008330mg [Xenopus laevis]